MNFENYTDEELRSMADSIYADLNIAACMDKDSDWHQGAFAALFVICEEMNRRKT